MKTTTESKLLIELEYEQNYLTELEQGAGFFVESSGVQIELQKKAVKKALAELDEYYLNLTEVYSDG